MEIHQILPTFSPGDAIGNEVIEINKTLTKWGYKSQIYAENIHPEMTAKKHLEYDKVSSKDNLLIFHFSIGSDISHYVRKLPDKKIIRYHGITPERYLYGINDYIQHLLVRGREELKLYPELTDMALANSRYTQLELSNLGFKRTEIFPLLLDLNIYDKNPNENLISRFKDNYVNILFVGRVIPQKNQHIILKIFSYYKLLNPRSRLFLIGNFEGCENYFNQLQEIVRKLKLKDVHIPGKVPMSDLISYYKLADVFLCMSEWETFCVPLVESMYFDTPVLAYNRTAIPDTLGNSGILINKLKSDEIAEMIDLVVKDEAFRNKIIRKQRERLKDFERPNMENLLKEYLQQVID
jgi:glycosyltransferase involved in cell wall biosynthesis